MDVDLLRSAVVGLVIASAAHGGTIAYVDADAPAGGDGASWATAYGDLQSALADTDPAITEIWVAAGVYLPAAPDGDPLATFAMRSGLAIYGGFGGDEILRAERNPALNVTELNGNEHFAHVLTANGVDATAVLDGFTVTGGTGDDGVSDRAGGGLFIDGGSPTIAGCTIIENRARIGAGVYVRDGSPVFTSCRIDLNTAAPSGEGAAIYAETTGASVLAINDSTLYANAAHQNHFATGNGGAIYCGPGVDLVVNRSTLGSNDTFHNQSYGNATKGGAICAMGGTVDLRDVVVQLNYSSLGAGVYATGPLECVNCVFTGNRGVQVGCAGPECGGAPDVYSGYGGGLYATNADVTLLGCTFAGNWAVKSAAGVMCTAQGGTIVNCVLWGNETYPVLPGEDPLPIVRAQVDGNADILFSDVQGLLQTIPGEDPPDPANFPGSIDVDPQFVQDPVLSSLGHATLGDLHLAPGSPCVDAGDNAAVPAGVDTDIEGSPRFVDVPDAPDTGAGTAPIVDFGAYEQGTGACAGDFNGDGSIGFGDLTTLLLAWGQADAEIDLDGDGVVGFGDLTALLNGWGDCPAT